MDTFGNEKDIRAAIDFFRTPLIVDVLWQVRDGRMPHDSPALSAQGDALDVALAALTDAGAVAAWPKGDWPEGEPPPAGPSLFLTPKGQIICALLDKVIDPYAPPLDGYNPLNGGKLLV